MTSQEKLVLTEHNALIFWHKGLVYFQMEESMQPLRPYERMDTLRQFLDHDREVLRFNCYWDDTDSMFGDSREMVCALLNV